MIKKWLILADLLLCFFIRISFTSQGHWGFIFQLWKTQGNPFRDGKKLLNSGLSDGSFMDSWRQYIQSKDKDVKESDCILINTFNSNLFRLYE